MSQTATATQSQKGVYNMYTHRQLQQQWYKQTDRQESLTNVFNLERLSGLSFC